MRRDPDVMPASHAGHNIGRHIHAVFARLFKPDVLFGFKAALVVGVFSMLAFFPTTVYFFQTERGVWVLIVRAANDTSSIATDV